MDPAEKHNSGASLRTDKNGELKVCYSKLWNWLKLFSAGPLPLQGAGRADPRLFPSQRHLRIAGEEK